MVRLRVFLLMDSIGLKVDGCCFSVAVGMSDALTNWLVEKTRSRDPFVIKFVSY
jgi:hypothetical protein